MRVTNQVVDSRTHAFVERDRADALAGAIAAGLVHRAKDIRCPHCGDDLVVVEYHSDGYRLVQCLEDTTYGLLVRYDEIEPVLP